MNVSKIEKLIATALMVFVSMAAAASSLPSVSDSTAGKPPVSKAKAAAKPVAKNHARQFALVTRPASRPGIRRVSAVRLAPERPSFGQLYGLHNASDTLELKSSVALVLDQDTDEVLFSKNSQAVLPIASLTKLMTAVVVTEANLSLDEPITITDDDVDTEKFSRSRLKVGTQLRREEMLHLALMSSENRAAHALGRTYPGGLVVFVAAMNRKARELGMNDTHYVEPTGLSSQNQSSARDLATLVKTAHEYQIIRELSTSPEFQVEVGNRQVEFHNTNGLIKNPSWDISLQKTGYISEAGRCLVMQAKLAGRQLIMVFLDSAGKYSRIGDAERVRRWVTESTAALPVIGAVKPKI
jgi:D-alanyl-D-alanine endopeptidase (penicillin-binding protein 7)